MYRCEHISCNLDSQKDKLVCVDCHDHVINPSRVAVEVRIRANGDWMQRLLVRTQIHVTSNIRNFKYT